MNLKPIFEKGQRLKVTAIAAVGVLIGGGGGLSAESVLTAVENFLSPPALPAHGTVVSRILPTMLVLEREDGSTVNVIVPQADFEQFVGGAYYVARPGSATIEGDIQFRFEAAPDPGPDPEPEEKPE